MAKMYYTLEEAVAKLGCPESAIKDAVRDGKLREFRDAGNVNYKVEEIDALAASGELGSSPPPPPPAAESSSSDSDALPPGLDDPELSASIGPIELADTGNPMPDLSSGGSISLGGTDAGVSGSGDSGSQETGSLDLSSFDTGSINIAAMESGSLAGIGDTELNLEPGQSGVNLAAGGDDMVSFEEDETHAGVPTPGKSKEDTVVSSVGISVFDEEDLDESADPMAKTVMSGSTGGTGLEDVGSGGSGLLDLTRESDDTSLGAELLDEIYPGDEGGGGGSATAEVGEATRAGLEGDIPEAEAEEEEETPFSVPAAESTAAVAAAPSVVRGDAFASAASGMMAVAVLVMCFTGLVLAAMIRDVWPSILEFVFAKLWMFGVGALVVAGLAMGLGIFLGRRSQRS